MDTLYLLLMVTTAFTGPIAPAVKVVNTHAATTVAATDDYAEAWVMDSGMTAMDCAEVLRHLPTSPMPLGVGPDDPRNATAIHFECAEEDAE